MYFWVPILHVASERQSISIIRSNIFIPVVRKKILDIMLPVRTPLLWEFILVESLAYI